MTTTPLPTGFLLLHGWQNRRPVDHWQHRLADRLTELGHQVGYPQLPDPDEPDLGRWLDTLHVSLADLGGLPRVVVCHSLACALWLHAVAAPAPAAADRVLLVAPPSPSVLAVHPEITAFVPPAVGPQQLAAAAPGGTRIVASDADEYCPEGAAAVYGGPLGVPVDLVPGGGHLNVDAGYGPWPSVLEWCLDPARPIAGRPATTG